jgi:hypothetical protein
MSDPHQRSPVAGLKTLQLDEINPKEAEMLTNRLFSKIMPARQAHVIRLIVIVAIAVTTGFIRIQTDQVIAPPGWRVLDWLWRVFICGC